MERLEERALLSSVTLFQKFEAVDWTSTGAGGIGNWGGGRATLSPGNVNGEIIAGYLYWHGIDNLSGGGNGVYDNDVVTFNGSEVTGVSLGMGGAAGWSTNGSSQAFRADVTHLLAEGVHVYDVAGLASKAGHNANGVSLVIIYQDGVLENDRDLYILDGNHVSGGPNSDGNWDVRLQDFLYRHGDVRAQLHISDGQTLPDSNICFETDIGSCTILDKLGHFDGNSVQNNGHGRAINGALWDIHTFDISAATMGGAGLHNLSLTQAAGASDALSLIAVFFDTSARPLNTPPVVTDVSVTGDEDSSLVGDLVGTDADGNSLRYSIVSSPAVGRLTLNQVTGRFSYVPPKDFHGTLTFTYVASDNESTSNIATVTLVVLPVNDLPVVSVGPVVTDEDVAFSGQVVATDVDDAVLSFATSTPPEHGTVVWGENGAFVYLPHDNYFGHDSFVVTVTDGSSGSVSVLVTVDVAAVNDAPVTFDSQVLTKEDESVTGQVTATDVDDAVLSFLLVDGPDHGSVALNEDGTFHFTPNADWHGDDSFVVEVTDGKSAPVRSVVTVHVDPVNDAPTASDAHFSVNRLAPVGTVVGSISGSDVDGDQLSYAITSGNETGAFAIDAATGTITVADSSAIGQHAASEIHLVVTVSDGKGGTATATVVVALNSLVVDFRVGGFSCENTVSLKGFPWAPVVVYSSEGFDVRDIDLATLRFGHTGDEPSFIKASGEISHYFSDQNGDGRLDLVLIYSIKSAGFQPGSKTATLKGNLKNGAEFVSTEPVVVAKGKPNHKDAVDAKKEAKKKEQAAKKEEQAAKKEEKDAKKDAKKEEQAAKKDAKEQEKAAKEAAKEQEKAAKEAAKDQKKGKK